MFLYCGKFPSHDKALAAAWEFCSDGDLCEGEYKIQSYIAKNGKKRWGIYI